jgi:hypothetical protein
LRSIICPKICWWVLSQMPYITMVLVQNPMAYSFSFTLGFSILNEWESQIIHGLPFLNAWKCGKFKNDGRVVYGRPTLLTMTKDGWPSWQIIHEWYHGSNMSSTKHVGDLNMSSYAYWITSNGVKLIHIHHNQWSHGPIEIASTCISLSIQALICCHLAKTIGLKSPLGGTFSNKYVHGYICVCYKCCTTWINSQNNPN